MYAERIGSCVEGLQEAAPRGQNMQMSVGRKRIRCQYSNKQSEFKEFVDHRHYVVCDNENKNIWSLVFLGYDLLSQVGSCQVLLEYAAHILRVEASQYWKWADCFRGGLCICN
jgi:hypothetical protein